MAQVKQYEFVAVDFDGTLCTNAFPETGEPITAVIEYVKQLAAEGSKIILHTCRGNGARNLPDEAITFCTENGISLFAVNENPESPYTDLIETDSCTAKKVFADLYIDDRAINVQEVIARQTNMKFGNERTLMKSDKRFWNFRAAADENAAPELILYGDIASETWWGMKSRHGSFRKS